MRQIPKYGIIGNGRLAKHMIYYFNLLNINILNWSRIDEKHLLNNLISQCDIILVLINDSEIENFIRKNLSKCNKILIHCSGSLSTELAIGLHPLMSFSNMLYDIDIYRSIHFITDNEYFDFQSNFPQLYNNCHFLNQNSKSYYHSLCVMSGNFTSILWAKLFKEFKKLNLPDEAIYPYLHSIFTNIKNDYNNALTGPLTRGDKITIDKNLESLKDDSFEDIYRAFIKQHERENNEHK